MNSNENKWKNMFHLYLLCLIKKRKEKSKICLKTVGVFTKGNVPYDPFNK